MTISTSLYQETPTDTKPLLSLRQVQFQYDNSKPLLYANLDILSGQLIEIVGHSGSGKTTLLQLIQGKIEPNSGTIQKPWHDLTANLRSWGHKQIALQPCCAIYTHSQLWHETTLIDNWMQVSRIHLNEQEALQQVKALIALLDLNPYAFKKPHQLPTGITKMTLLGRALILKPCLLLIDDLLDGLDLHQLKRIWYILTELQSYGIAVCYTARRYLKQKNTIRWYINDDGIVQSHRTM